MNSLPAPAFRGYLIPPELERDTDDDANSMCDMLAASFDGEDTDGLDHLDQLAASIRLLEPEPFQSPADLAPPVAPAPAAWLRAEAFRLRLRDAGPAEDLELFLAARIDDLAAEFERFGAETVRAFRRAETADMQRIFSHHQDIGRVTGLDRPRSEVIERIANFA